MAGSLFCECCCQVALSPLWGPFAFASPSFDTTVHAAHALDVPGWAALDTSLRTDHCAINGMLVALQGLVPYADDDDDIKGSGAKEAAGARSPGRAGAAAAAAAAGAKSATASIFSRSPAARPIVKASNWFPQQLSKPAAGAGGSSAGGSASAGTSGSGGVQQHHRLQPGQLAALASSPAHAPSQQDTAPGLRDSTFREASDHGAAHRDSLLQTQNVLLRNVPRSSTAPLAQAEWKEGDRGQESGGLLRPGAGAPSRPDDDPGSHVLPMAVSDMRTQQPTVGGIQLGGQPVTTGAQYPDAPTAPAAALQQSLGFPGAPGATTTGTPLGVMHAGVVQGAVQGVPQGTVAQGVAQAQTVAGDADSTRTASERPCADPLMAGAQETLPAGFLAPPAQQRNRLSGQEQGEGLGVPVTSIGHAVVPIGAPAAAADASGAVVEPQVDTGAATGAAGEATGVTTDPGSAASAAQQPPPSGALSAAATATASLQSLVVSGTPRQLAGVQGSVAQGLPVPDALQGNENISVPIVATGVPMSDAHTPHVATGAQPPVGDASSGAAGNPAADQEDSGKGTGQKRIADVDLSLQIENGALSPASKALKVGSACAGGGQVSVGQRSTPPT